MSGELGLIVDGVRGASKFLLRDYYELENLQRSANLKSLADFKQKACIRLRNNLVGSLEKYAAKIIFDKQEVKQENISDKAILVELLDGQVNFMRSLPFFAVMVTFVSKNGAQIEADKSVIYFPVSGELVKVEKNQPVLLERYGSNVAGSFRSKTSAVNDLAHAVCLLDKGASINHEVGNTYSYGSALYSVLQLISGKADIVVLKDNPLTRHGIELFVERAGGRTRLEKGQIIASNLPLSDKI